MGSTSSVPQKKLDKQDKEALDFIATLSPKDQKYFADKFSDSIVDFDKELKIRKDLILKKPKKPEKTKKTKKTKTSTKF